MPNPAIDCVVFDFDGTLASLNIDFDLMRGRVAALAAKYLKSRPEHNSRAVLEWIEELASIIGPDPGAGFKANATALVKEMELEAAKNGLVFAYSDRVLAGLAGQGVKTAVITRNCKDAVRAAHPELPSLTGAVLTRDDVVRVKPDPAHLMDALAVLGALPERSLMVGDHPMDIATGKRAGALAAGVLSGSGREDGLRAAGADFIAANVSELMDVLTRKGLLGG